MSTLFTAVKNFYSRVGELGDGQEEVQSTLLQRILCHGFFQDVGGGTRPWEILWQLPVQRVDLLATDVADDYGRTIWRHATPFAPLGEKPADFAQAYDALNLSITHPHPKESGISSERGVET